MLRCAEFEAEDDNTASITQRSPDEQSHLIKKGPGPWAHGPWAHGPWAPPNSTGK